MFAISRASCALFLLVKAVVTVIVCSSTADLAKVFSSSAVASATKALLYTVWV